jgi:hypothetical protein
MTMNELCAAKRILPAVAGLALAVAAVVTWTAPADAAGSGARAGRRQRSDPARQAAAAPRALEVTGRLLSLDVEGGRIVLRTGSGDEKAWTIPGDALEEARRVSPGETVKVLYTRSAEGDERLTGLEVPGRSRTDEVTYVNGTGNAVILSVEAATGSTCPAAPTEGGADPDPGFTINLAPGASVPATFSCWCCGLGRASCAPTSWADPGHRVVMVFCAE